MSTRRQPTPKQQQLEHRVLRLDRRVSTLEDLCRTYDERLRTVEDLVKKSNDGDLQSPG